MDFNGLQNFDFDFFRKKDKMQREEYENGRNEVKTHFRSLCYEMQKIHHKRTGGVLILDKDFQNFNKRSSNIYADYVLENSIFKIAILMNCDHLRIEGYLLAENDEIVNKLVNIVKVSKKDIFDFMLDSKFTCMHVEIGGKEDKENTRKLSTIDLNEKNYEDIESFINTVAAKNKKSIRLGIGYSFSKNECVKQGKNFAETAYEAMLNSVKYIEKIG